MAITHTWLRLVAAALLALLAAMAAPAMAQEDGEAAEVAVEAVEDIALEEVLPAIDSGDTAWMLTATALVLMMTIPGLALFYGGMVRKMNVLTIMMQCFAITCAMSVLWMIAGYSLAFTEGGWLYGGFDKFFLSGVGVDAAVGTIPETVFMTFQMTFAAITPALIVGAFADRMKFSAMLLFMTGWLFFVYAPTAHMVWGGGLLADWGVLDFAGGTVVHINAGIAGLVACIVIGKRTGYGSVPFPPHNLTLSLIGASLLWVGWFGFNAGSQLAADGRAGMAMAVTQIATAAAALSWMFAEWIAKRRPSILGIVSGAVGGLVAITPAAGFVAPGGALVIGIAAGVICFFCSTTVKNALGYDDSLDVFGVHGVGGIVGAVLTGVFATSAVTGDVDPVGLIDGNGGQILAQIYGVLVTIVYCGVITLVLLKLIDWTVGLRVDAETERDGLDLALHGETVQ